MSIPNNKLTEINKSYRLKNLEYTPNLHFNKWRVFNKILSGKISDRKPRFYQFKWPYNNFI